MNTGDFIGYWLECVKSFQDFKEGENYWLEALSTDNQYNIRSDNLKGKTRIITVKELFSNFKQTENKI
jgi:hypothetical protein